MGVFILYLITFQRGIHASILSLKILVKAFRLITNHKMLTKICLSVVALQNILVDETYENTPFPDLLNDIENKYHVPLYYKTEWLPDTVYSMSISNKSIPEAIEEILKYTSLTFAIFNNNSIIIAPESLLSREFSANYLLL